MYRIAVIIPYFGKFPNYFQLWLDSAGLNPTVDFIIFTDNADDYVHAPNIRFIPFDLHRLKNLIEEKLHMSCCLSSAYKLCDFRPAYGLIFEDYIKDFDFWGYGDIDIVWGNIRAFITDNILRDYDKIQEMGHLTLMRNKPQFNHLFKDWKSPVTRTFYEASHLEEHVGFDEMNGEIPIHRLWCTEGKLNIYSSFDIVADIFPWVVRYESHWSREDAAPFICAYDNGELNALFARNGRVEKKPMMYIHLQKRPMNILTKDPQRFLVAECSFLPFREVTAAEIEAYNRCSDFLPGVKGMVRPKGVTWRRLFYKWLVGRCRKAIFNLLHYRCCAEFHDMETTLRTLPVNQAPRSGE